jgi:HSP90 family molecular chaperone
MQESRVVRVIKKQLVKRCLDMISDLAAKGEEEYEKFWSQFGKNIKLGIIDDSANQSKLAALSRVRTQLPLHALAWQSCHSRAARSLPFSNFKVV